MQFFVQYSQDELKKVRLMLIKRYGKGFPQECVNDNCVNPKVSVLHFFCLVCVEFLSGNIDYSKSV
jgi:hypothetical protein